MLADVDDDSVEDMAEAELILEAETLLDIVCVLDDTIAVASSLFIGVDDTDIVSADVATSGECSFVDVYSAFD